MDHFNYKDGVLHAEQVPLPAIIEQYGTPCYVYSRATIERHWHAFDKAFAKIPHMICYSTKANSNLGVLSIFARLQSGFDIVSGGELERVLKAGGRADHIVFSGVGKSAVEIAAALEAGIRCFNVESTAEMQRIDRIAAQQNKVAPVSIRVNPDVDANTHPYISTGLKENKFGVDREEAIELFRQAREMANVRIEGVDCHIGSQLTEITPFLDALDRVLDLIEELRTLGIEIRHIDLGGGLGIRYDQESPPEPADYAQALAQQLESHHLELILEPGRAIMGNAGILVTRVEYIKHSAHKNFAIVDAAMNDLLRPALYNAWQKIIPVTENPQAPTARYDVVGPVCETGDFLGKDRELALAENDLLAVRSSGAYGAVMSSNYNSRPRAAEVIVDGDRVHLVRRRESYTDLFRLESLLPD